MAQARNRLLSCVLADLQAKIISMENTIMNLNNFKFHAPYDLKI
jgi:hypothetical protein